jgi:serine/threonine protein kinase
MKPERWKKLDALFHEALELQGEARAVHLAKACGDDGQLRVEAERLIAAHERESSFIDAPIFAEAAKLADDYHIESPIGHRIGPYKVISQLGRGGMGEVFLAEDSRLGRKVALKVLPAAFTENRDRVQRFEREAKAASALNHPNILTIYEIGQASTDAGGTHYIISEFVAGETLRALIERGRLGINEAIAIAQQVAGALDVAHQAGIIHRDIKPENVMVRPDGLVKVLDFGLAKLTERAAAPAEIDSEANTLARLSTEPGVVMGTVSYMSPEQARGQRVDHRTDIFSLGVMLYEMITGRRPFEGATTSDVIAALLKSEPPPLTAHLPDAPRELERIVSKSLRKDREERYQVVNELFLDLKSLQQESNSAAASAAADRGRKRPKLFTPRRMLALAALVILLVAAGGLLWWYFRSEASPPIGLALPFTSYPGFEINPALSPNGDQVAFAWNGDKRDNFDIWVKLVGSNSKIQLTKNPAEDLSPAWSPDGRWIAVSHREAGDLAEGLFLVSAQTGAKQRLTRLPVNSAGDFAPIFSPDGRALLFSRLSGYSAAAEIYLLSLSKNSEPVGEARHLKTDERFVRSPVWTLDGRHILYLAAPHSEREQTELRMITASGVGTSKRILLLEGERGESWPPSRLHSTHL